MIIGANNTVTTYRMAVGSKETYSGTATLSSVPCYIEQVEPQLAVILDDQNAFSTFRAYIEGAVDIIIGDKLVDSQGNTYIASGVQKFENNTDTDDQTEVTMVKKYQKS